MNRKRVSRKQLESLCGEVHPDDGIDPADFFRPARKQNSSQRKAWQLCHQVADTLNLVLSSEVDDVLRDVHVVAVTPAPDASQLLVLVAPAVPGQSVNATDVLARLDAAAGRLRSEVAAAITRRRAPKLVFQFIASQQTDEVQP